jgi:hypothetical protein
MIRCSRKLRDKELHNFICSPNIIRMIKVREDEMGSECSLHGRQKECVQAFGGKARKKRALGRSRHRWEGKMDIT